MRKLTALKALAAAGAMLAATAATAAMAATPVVSGGTLVGATGVTVNGSTYNVDFIDGACTTAFSPCTSASNFTFQTQADATAAANALAALILGTSYDSAPGTINGCTSSNLCIIATPYEVLSGAVSYMGVSNFSSGSNPVSFGSTTTSLDQGTIQTWARFTLAATSVPEPASWAMMLLGFAGIGLAARRRTRGWSPAA